MSLGEEYLTNRLSVSLHHVVVSVGDLVHDRPVGVVERVVAGRALVHAPELASHTHPPSEDVRLKVLFYTSRYQYIFRKHVFTLNVYQVSDTFK